MPDRERVLILIKCLDPGGAERLLVEAAAYRNRSAFEYEVAYVIDHMNGLVAELEQIDVPVHPLGATGNLSFRWLLRLRRLLRTGSFAVVHLHLPYTASLARLVIRTLPRRDRPRVVYTEHSQQQRLAWPVRLLSRATLRYDDRIVTVSEATRDELPRAHRERAEVVIHGIDPRRVRSSSDRRTVVRRELGLSDEAVLVVTVANLRPQKAYPRLLAAAAQLVAEGLPVTFVAAGDGPLAAELAEQRDRLGLSQRFRFLGFRDDTAALTAAADLFVLASDYEGLPVAVMEAVAVGTPVVATAVGELPRILTDGVNARLVPPTGHEPLADALRELVINPELRARLGRAGRQLSEMFDVRLATERIESIYADLLQR